MESIPIATILTLPVGTPIPSTSGTVGYISDQRSGKVASGKNAGKPWKVQDVELIDGPHKIRVSVWNLPSPIPLAWKGQTAWVLAGQRSDKKGTCGVSVKSNSYTNKEGQPVETKVIDVSEKGSFVLATTGNQIAQPAAQPAPSTATPPSNPPSTPEPSAPIAQPSASAPPTPSAAAPKADAKGDTVDAVIEAKKFLARSGNLLVMAVEETLSVIETVSKRNGQPWTDKDRAAALGAMTAHLVENGPATLFIELGRKTGAVHNMPYGDLTKWTDLAKARQQEKQSAATQRQERNSK